MSPELLDEYLSQPLMWMPLPAGSAQEIGTILTHSNHPFQRREDYLTELAQRVEVLILEAAALQKPEDLAYYREGDSASWTELGEEEQRELAIKTVVMKQIAPILNLPKFINRVGTTSDWSAWQWSQILTLNNEPFQESLFQLMESHCYAVDLSLFPMQPIPVTPEGLEMADSMNLGEWLQTMADMTD